MKPGNTKTEALVKLAIRAGCVSSMDIAEETGIPIDIVRFAISLLETENNVKGVSALRAILSPKQVAPPYQPQSRDIVILETSFDPHIAADLIEQVLGADYSARLAEALLEKAQA